MTDESVVAGADPAVRTGRGRRILLITALACLLWVVGIVAASRWLSRDGAASMGGMPGMPGMRTTASPMTAAADILFAASMTADLEHVRRAAALVDSRTLDPDVRAVAVSLRRGGQLHVLRQWLIMWEAPMPRAGPSGDGAEELERLAAASPEDGDRLFVDIVRRHYIRTRSLAREELAQGQFPPARALAQRVLDGSSSALQRLDVLRVNPGA